MLIELNMQSSGYLSFWCSSYNLGMIAFRHRCDRLEDTLDINHHGIHCSGYYSQLLLKEITGYTHAMTH